MWRLMALDIEYELDLSLPEKWTWKCEMFEWAERFCREWDVLLSDELRYRTDQLKNEGLKQDTLLWTLRQKKIKNITCNKTNKTVMKVFLIAYTAHCVQISPSDSKWSRPQCTLRFWLVYNKELNNHWSMPVPCPHPFALCLFSQKGRQTFTKHHSFKTLCVSEAIYYPP